MLNPRWFHNSRPDGVPILQIEGDGSPRLSLVPLKATDLRGDIAGPLARFDLVQVFSFSRSQLDVVIEALYRFPLPGDAAVLSVRVKFGEVDIMTELKPRKEAEDEYAQAKERGDQAVLAGRESPDVFTLRVAGIAPDEEVTITTSYVQLGDRMDTGYSFRVPLTLAPRYVRQDERYSPYAKGQPLALVRDPGHRFQLDITSGAGVLTSPTHDIVTSGGRTSLKSGEVVPDRDCVLVWTPESTDRPTAHLFYDHDAGGDHFLALVSPPAAFRGNAPAKELIVLVDHSGSMSGAKWEAADWAVGKLLRELRPEDHFNLCLFHNDTLWFSATPVAAGAEKVASAISFLKDRSTGGTELGVALEQAMAQSYSPGDQDRQVVVLTDGQVSDAGRIYEVVEGGAKGPHPRRTSIICIDSAPNAYFAKSLARKGKGVSRFLTSSPDEGDITSALEEILEEMRSPLLGSARLVFDGEVAAVLEADLDRSPGSSSIDLSNLRSGSSACFIGRFAPDKGARRAKLFVAGLEEDVPCIFSDAVRPLFGAGVVAELERLILSAHVADLAAGLQAMGLEPPAGMGKRSVYHENELRRSREALEELLTKVSLEHGVASFTTSFIAVRREAGRKVEGVSVVANALPQGWSDDFLMGQRPRMVLGRNMVAPSMASPSPMDAMVARGEQSGGSAQHKRPAPGPTGREVELELYSGTLSLEGDETILFDSRREDDRMRMPGPVQFSRLTASYEGRDMGEGIVLHLYIGDLSLPVLKVELSELMGGGGRPLSTRIRDGDEIVAVLIDSSGRGFGGRLTLVLRT